MGEGDGGSLGVSEGLMARGCEMVAIEPANPAARRKV